MSKIIVQEKVIFEIPLNEYYIDDGKEKPLIFVQHGYTSNKNKGSDWLAMLLMRNGYFVVAIDAYKHGKRIREPFLTGSKTEKSSEIFKVIKRTSEDIKKLYNQYYSENFKSVGIVGISMGAMIALYLKTIMQEIELLVSVIGTPSFHDFVIENNHNGFFNEQSDEYVNYLNYLKRIEPLEKVDAFLNTKLFMTVGENDQTIPLKYSKIFCEKLKNLGANNTFYKEYQCGHDVPWDMQDDIVDFVIANL